jgi:hypothetical protein
MCPNLTRFNPAAFSPWREGLPPAAKVRALYQADSLIVKGQVPGFRYQARKFFSAPDTQAG